MRIFTSRSLPRSHNWQGCIRLNPKNLEAVSKLPALKRQKHIESFLGLAGYYRRFTDGFSNIAANSIKLLEKDTLLLMSQQEEMAFSTLKTKLCEEPLLINPDFFKPFIATTDDSGFTIGAILLQGEIGKHQHVIYILAEL